ncbi:MAG: S-layer protein, partial [Verrucomicrobia bacterium]|nr:S-layer protein [Verrucomicrobiota bacterium]
MKQMKLFKLIFLSGVLVCGSNAILTARAGETLRILPDQISLHGPNAFQRLMVVHEKDGITRGEVPVLSWESSQSAIANIHKNGTVRATGNGTATIKAVTESGEVSVVVNVTNQDEQEVWSFNRHILPVMAKAGCNQGACHGALAGKGGFRLSLRGYDPESDHYNITREALGRRIELLSPERSLILTKPTMAVRHKGGKRLDPYSREYQILAEWIAQGATPPQAEEAEL